MRVLLGFDLAPKFDLSTWQVLGFRLEVSSFALRRLQPDFKALLTFETEYSEFADRSGSDDYSGWRIGAEDSSKKIFRFRMVLS
jgi:hypothetical protein